MKSGLSRLSTLSDGEDRALRIWEKGGAPVKLDHVSYKLKAEQRCASVVGSVLSSRVDSRSCFLGVWECQEDAAFST